MPASAQGSFRVRGVGRQAVFRQPAGTSAALLLCVGVWSCTSTEAALPLSAESGGRPGDAGLSDADTANEAIDAALSPSFVPDASASPRRPDGGGTNPLIDASARPDAAVGQGDAGLDSGALFDAGVRVSAPGRELVALLPEPESGEAFYLSQTGLYVDIATRTLSADVVEFEPRHRLWSDSAEKLRYLRLPRGETIDTSDITSWTFPVGTMLFKQFSRDGLRVETRLIARTGTGERDYWMGAFLWNEDETDARFIPEGQMDARGTSHDVPTTTQCGTCHNGERGRVLGVSAVQLDGALPLSLEDLVDGGLLSAPPDSTRSLGAPGEPDVSEALGYLHANCGHCHNPRGSARPDTDLNLRLVAGEEDPLNTPTYLTTLDVPLQNFMDATLTTRVVPGEPDMSALPFRMQERGTRTEMPPLGSEEVDTEGVDLVRAWIERL